MIDPALIDTIVIVMMENRSFDHMLGHLSLPPTSMAVDGLTLPLDQDAYVNTYQGEAFTPFPINDGRLTTDLPHSRTAIATQLGQRDAMGRYAMDGFVEAYYDDASAPSHTDKPDPMAYLPADQVPITHFLATSFAVCDRWFASLPTSTQPNRLMADTGTSSIQETGGLFPPLTGRFVLDWLSKAGGAGVRWRVYHAGLSFFSLLRLGEGLGDTFRSFDNLAADCIHESDETFPQVIFIEPSYEDAPHLGSDVPNDNHPPLAVGFGEQFLRVVYEALTAPATAPGAVNPDRWSKTVMILTYDEHGGFFDHISPLPISSGPPPGSNYPVFESTGARVPAVVVSPLVTPGRIYHEPLDHTSILQFLSWRFTPGTPYSPEVATRAARGLGNVADVLDLATPRADIPPIPQDPIESVVTLAPAEPAATPMQQVFHGAATQMLATYPVETRAKYPELVHWQQVMQTKAVG